MNTAISHLTISRSISMVNCKNCGAPLTLEDAVCPHCGTPNPEAKEHLEKLAKLDRDFRKTKTEVAEEVRKSKSGYGVLVILVMVLLANLFMIPLHAATYDIAEKIVASKMGSAMIRETMDELLEEGEYIEMAVFNDKYQLSYQEYGDYNRIAFLAEYYNRLISNVTDYLYGKDPYNDPLVSACQNIKDFVSEYEYSGRYIDDRKMMKYIEDLNKEFEAYIRTYLKLTDEDIAGINDMSNSELLLRISERMAYEEE